MSFRIPLLPLAALSILLCLCAAAPTGAASPARLAVTGGRVLPVSGPAIENGTVLIEGGRIVAVGGPSLAVPAGYERYDARGKTVTPGLIDAYGFTGLIQVELDRATNDGAENTAYLFAQGRVIDAYDPELKSVRLTRGSGVTAMLVAPREGDLFAGQSAVFTLAPGTVDTAGLRTPAFLHATLGEAAKGDDEEGRGKKPGTRMGVIAKLRGALIEAQAYAREHAPKPASAPGKPGEAPKPPAADFGKAALAEALAGRLPVAIYANRASDIRAALRVADEFKLKIVIVGGAEAWRVAGELAARGVPVILTVRSRRGDSPESLGARPDSAAVLRKAGVRCGYGTAEVFNARNLPYWAALLEGDGLNFDEALRLVTLDNAEILGVADRTGSLEAGKRADLVVWEGEPLDTGGRPVLVLAGGESIGP